MKSNVLDPPHLNQGIREMAFHRSLETEISGSNQGTVPLFKVSFWSHGHRPGCSVFTSSRRRIPRYGYLLKPDRQIIPAWPQTVKAASEDPSLLEERFFALSDWESSTVCLAPGCQASPLLKPDRLLKSSGSHPGALLFSAEGDSPYCILCWCF